MDYRSWIIDHITIHMKYELSEVRVFLSRGTEGQRDRGTEGQRD
jgi:hypothetical protein